MAIRIEFFGIARQRVGVPGAIVAASADELSLADVLRQLCSEFPHVASALLVDGRLHPTLAANLDGQRFISDPTTPIRDGQHLLILSADAGG